MEDDFKYSYALLLYFQIELLYTLFCYTFAYFIKYHIQIVVCCISLFCTPASKVIYQLMTVK